MRFDPRARDLREQQRIMLFVIGDHGNVGGVALVAGAGMGDLAQFCHSCPTNWTDGLASSRGSKTDATATTSRADLNAPPPAAGPLVESGSTSLPIRMASPRFSVRPATRTRTSYGSFARAEPSVPCSESTP